jgi:DNA-binding transcriptional LysR family regulator
VAKDRVAQRIGPDMRMAVVGAPSHFAKRPRPKIPQDLTAHDCVNLRLPTAGGLYAWEFERGKRELKVRVEGQLVFNNIALRLNAVLAGLGLAYLPEDLVQTHLTGGQPSRQPRENHVGCRRAGAGVVTARYARRPAKVDRAEPWIFLTRGTVRRNRPSWKLRRPTQVTAGRGPLRNARST